MNRPLAARPHLATLLIVLAIAAAALLLGLLLRGSGPGSGEAPFAGFNARQEAAEEGLEAHKASFEAGEGGEASREGPGSPAAEQVDDRAYPRSYVDDRLARRSERAFDRVPGHLSAADFDTPQDFAAADPAGPWSALGPLTPTVPGENSQFIEPRTDPPSVPGDTEESGRVTALAIDPDCGTTAGDCKMWVAAAGGGIWRTDDALAADVQWIAPPDDLPTNAFGSLYYDSTADVLYAGSGEPNGSSDSEAGLGLFRSTDSGATWSLVPGSAAVATNRSIGAIVTDPSGNIYIGTDVARHGSASVNGGRRTPPNAPTLGVYRSTDDGATFTLEQDLSTKTPPSPNAASTGNDWFQGGITKLELDPNDPDILYAGVFGYGVWRADQSSPPATWGQVFHTMNQNDFSNPNNPIGDETGDRTEFDLVKDGTTTRMYVGDASDDWAIDAPSAMTPLPQAWRSNDVSLITPSTTGSLDNAAAGWQQLSSSTNGQPGFGVYGYCQNGQCGYDSFVAHPPGAPVGTVWYGGSMNYDELPAYDQFGFGEPPRSNGRAVVRSLNADSPTATSATWQDMTAVLDTPTNAWGWGVQSGIHPDLHAIVFADGGDIAFIGSDGGVARIDTSTVSDRSASCAARTYNYDSNDPEAAPTALAADDLADCNMLLSGLPGSVTPINDGLNDLQFQSLSFNPDDPSGSLLGGTQDNGTWLYNGSQPPATQWFESVGGDGGQSGFDPGTTSTRYHNYFDATPEVNFDAGDPETWYAIYDPLLDSGEESSFYTPFLADPNVPGRAFIGLEHVWRTDDNGGSQAYLDSNGCASIDLDPFRSDPCGDWVRLGGNLTTASFGATRTGQFVVAVDRAQSDNATVWAATRTGRLFVAKNADDTPGAVGFRRIDTPSTPGRFISGISVDPDDANHAWVSYSGYSAYTPSTPGHVFEVTYNPSSHTATFTDRSLNIGDQPVTGIAFDGGSGDAYAATDFGVLRLAAGASQWVDAAAGLPKAAVYGISLAQAGRQLFAATHGRGAYALQLAPAQPKPPAPTPAQEPASQPGTSSNPSASLKKIKAVTKGKPTIIKGTAADPAGIAAVTVKFGDNKKAAPKLAANGTFTVRHHFRKAKKYAVKLIVTGSGGSSAKTERNAKVKKKTS